MVEEFINADISISLNIFSYQCRISTELVLVNVTQDLVVKCIESTITSKSDNYFRAVNFSSRMSCLYRSSKKAPRLV